MITTIHAVTKKEACKVARKQGYNVNTCRVFAKIGYVTVYEFSK